jgi:hypothetical protein
MPLRAANPEGAMDLRTLVVAAFSLAPVAAQSTLVVDHATGPYT